MKKSDLKNRMVVECRNGRRYMVIDDMLLSTTGYNYLSTYTSDLLMKTTPLTEHLAGYDIVKVYRKRLNVLSFMYLDTNDVLWERSEVKEVTMSEIEKKFGCKVKIVNK